MKKIGIHGKDIEVKQRPFIESFFGTLGKYVNELWVSSKFAPHLSSLALPNYTIHTFHHKNAPQNLDAFVSLGGDGTLLESVTYVGRYETPLLGINTGRMGFLATVSPQDTDRMLSHLFEGTHQIDSRSLLSLSSSMPLFDGIDFGLNDFTILRQDTSSMINIHLYVNQELLNSYWSDGVIVCTPTGSTGYSLSCGGPLVYPQSKSFAITPINPHNLTARPIIVPNNSEISFRVKGRSKKFLISLDSRFDMMDASTTLCVKKSPFEARLIHPPGQHYFKTLRQKLSWGVDIRN